jgi:hypothetical protein
MNNPGSSRFKSWEIALLILGGLLFVLSLAIYVSDYPLLDFLRAGGEAGHDSIGRVSRVDGSFRRERAGRSEFQDIGMDAELYPRDMIVTGPHGHATVTLEGGSVIELAPSTLIRLESESRRSITGISRTTRVRLVSGEVQGKVAQDGKSKLLILRHDEEIDLSESGPVKADSEKPMRVARPIPVQASRPLPIVPPPRPSPTPIPTLSLLPSPSPVPSPQPLPEPTFALSLPKEGAKFAIAGGSRAPVLVVPIEARLFYPASGDVHSAAPPPLSVKISVYRLAGEEGRRVGVMEEEASAIPGVPVKMKFQPNSPGRYRIEAIRGSVVLAHREFTILPDFEAIELRQPDPFVDKGDGNELRKTGVRLSWAPYPGVTHYRVRISRPGKPLEEAEVSGTTYVVRRVETQDSERLYVVSARLQGGWSVHSASGRLVFDFTPPTPITPANHQVMSGSDKMREGKGILLTWQKTGVGDRYLLTISDDPSFRRVLVSKQRAGNFLVFKPSDRDETYYWRIQAMEDGMLSRPSEIFDFSVKQRGPAPKASVAPAP